MIPQIINVKIVRDLILAVDFSDGKTREYDCSNITNRNENFKKLENFNFFKTVHIDAGGHGLSWDDYVDVSEYEILNNSEIKS